MNEEARVDEDEISLLDLAIALGEEKRTLITFPLLSGVIAVVVSLIMTPVYTAKTVIMPPQQQQSSAASALASLGALAGLAGSVAGLKSPDEMYGAFLQSAGLRTELIQRFNLKERYEEKTIDETLVRMKEQVKVVMEKKSGLISIEVDDKDPQFAAQLANAHVEGLRQLMGRLAVTDAQQRRVFYEQAIAKTQAELAEAETKFREARERSGMQVMAVIAEGSVRASTEIRAQIAAKEVQAAAMSRFATPQNADFQRLASELAALRAQLEKFEKGSGDNQAAQSPLHQQTVNAYRDIKAREAMMGVLLAQYESARVDEAREGPLVQQVDVATPPERRSKPKRTLIVIVAILAGLMLGILVAFMRRALRRAEQSSETQAQVRRFKEVWKLRG